MTVNNHDNTDNDSLIALFDESLRLILLKPKLERKSKKRWNAKPSFISAVTKTAHLSKQKVADATKVWHFQTKAEKSLPFKQ